MQVVSSSAVIKTPRDLPYRKPPAKPKQTMTVAVCIFQRQLGGKPCYAVRKGQLVGIDSLPGIQINSEGFAQSSDLSGTRGRRSQPSFRTCVSHFSLQCSFLVNQR